MFLCVPGKEVKGLQEMSVCECVREMGRAGQIQGGRSLLFT